MTLNSSFPFNLANKYDILLYSFLQRTHDDELIKFETLVIVWTFLKKTQLRSQDAKWINISILKPTIISQTQTKPAFCDVHSFVPYFVRLKRSLAIHLPYEIK